MGVHEGRSRLPDVLLALQEYLDPGLQPRPSERELGTDEQDKGRTAHEGGFGRVHVHVEGTHRESPVTEDPQDSVAPAETC